MLVEVFESSPVMLLGFRIGSKCVGMTGSQLSIMCDLLYMAMTFEQMLKDDCRTLNLLRGIYLLQNSGNRMMNLCAPSEREGFIKILCKQRMPEMVGDVDTLLMLSQDTTLQGFLNECEHLPFIERCSSVSKQLADSGQGERSA